MPKDIKGKPYSPPLVYDIGGPNLNVVGLSVTMCSTGSGGTVPCLAGGGGTIMGTECDSGGTVAISCSTGSGPGTAKWCSTGTTADLRCRQGNAGGSCANGNNAA